MEEILKLASLYEHPIVTHSMGENIFILNSSDLKADLFFPDRIKDSNKVDTK